MFRKKKIQRAIDKVKNYIVCVVYMCLNYIRVVGDGRFIIMSITRSMPKNEKRARRITTFRLTRNQDHGRKQRWRLKTVALQLKLSQQSEVQYSLVPYNKVSSRCLTGASMWPAITVQLMAMSYASPVFPTYTPYIP